MKVRALVDDSLRQLREVWQHPLHDHPARRMKALARLLCWQLLGRLSNQAFVVQITPRLQMHLRRGLVSREIYLTGLHEFDDLLFIAHVLRRGERLLDVGANAGIYSLFAASEAGAFCDAFEPVPEIAAILEQNILSNELQEYVRVHRHALGSSKGTVALSKHQGPTTHKVRTGEPALEVPLERLDDVVAGLDTFTVLKIDVEGLELEVLAGAERLLSSPRLGAVLVETGELGARYGHTLVELHDMLTGAGLSPVSYDGIARKVSPLNNIASTGNTIYVRNLDAVTARCRAAPVVRLRHHEL